MKLRNLALVLTTAALLPTFAHADAVLASFERDMNHEPVLSQNTVIASSADSLADATDAVLASFERDMNREPAATRNTSLAITAEPLVDAANTAL